MAPDPRRVIGNIVSCKATQVTNLHECQRRYGSLAKTKMLEGVVLEVHTERNNITLRQQTYIEADWNLGNGRTKRVKVHLRFIMAAQIAAPPETTVDEPPPPEEIQQQPVAEIPEIPVVVVAVQVPPTEPPTENVIPEPPTPDPNANVNEITTQIINNQPLRNEEAPQTPTRQQLVTDLTTPPEKVE